jgi:hypothetical protein
MATFNKFDVLTASLANGLHNLASDQITVALSSTVPTAGMANLAALTGEIAYTNLSARNVTTTSSTQTSGVYSLVLADLVLTASGAVATFQYVVLYNSTAAGGELIGWYDYGSAVTMANLETFTIDFTDAQTLFDIT